MQNSPLKNPDNAIAIRDLGIAMPTGRGVSRLWNEKHWVFRNVTLNIKRSESLAVLGRNGSGKSTLLRVLAGILEPDEGTAEMQPDLKAHILAPGAGFVFHMTGRENLFYSGIMQGFSKDEIKEQEEKIIEFSEIGKWIDEPVGAYSSGMRARLGFSLSIFLASDVLMIDESLSAGDPPFRQKARKAIAELVKSDKTVIMVSHGLRFIQETCARAIIFDRGQLSQAGDTATVLQKYRKLVDA